MISQHILVPWNFKWIEISWRLRNSLINIKMAGICVIVCLYVFFFTITYAERSSMHTYTGLSVFDNPNFLQNVYLKERKFNEVLLGYRKENIKILDYITICHRILRSQFKINKFSYRLSKTFTTTPTLSLLYS